LRKRDTSTSDRAVGIGLCSTFSGGLPRWMTLFFPVPILQRGFWQAGRVDSFIIP
jgi:hypothetical protein